MNHCYISADWLEFGTMVVWKERMAFVIRTRNSGAITEIHLSDGRICLCPRGEWFLTNKSFYIYEAENNEF